MQCASDSTVAEGVRSVSGSGSQQVIVAMSVSGRLSIDILFLATYVCHNTKRRDEKISEGEITQHASNNIYGSMKQV